MSAQQALPTDMELLTATAEGIEPGAPQRAVKVPPGETTYSFTMDNDLFKLVTLRPGHNSLSVLVRYATDIVVEQHRHTINNARSSTILVDGMGLVVKWRTPLIPGLQWPEIGRTRRF